MDKTVPTGAAMLLDFIGGIEAPRGYDTIFGNNQNKLAVPLTSMALDDVIAAQKSWSKRFGSSASGRYQFMQATLQNLKSELGLLGSQKFDANLQDRLGYHLLRRRGYDDYMAGKITRVEFGKRIAQEWASMPVLADMQGAHRALKRGQSYYAGDALNKSLVAPEKLETVLALAKKAPDPVAAPPAPVPPSPPAVSDPVPVAPGVVVPSAPMSVPVQRNRISVWGALIAALTGFFRNRQAK